MINDFSLVLLVTNLVTEKAVLSVDLSHLFGQISDALSFDMAKVQGEDDVSLGRFCYFAIANSLPFLFQTET